MDLIMGQSSEIKSQDQCQKSGLALGEGASEVGDDGVA